MPELKHARANGLEFAYFEEGDGPLVLIAHGFPDTAHTWDVVRPALASAGYRAVTPFMRGYHPSEVPKHEDFHSDTLGRDLLALADKLKREDEKAIFIGHDWGASAVYSAAGIAPETMRLMITLAIPHPAAMLPTPRVLWSVRHFWTLSRRNAAAMVRADDFAFVDELWRRWSPAWVVPPEETRDVKESFRHPGSLEAALGYYRAITPSVPKTQRRPVQVPAVAIGGTDDIVEPSAYERARSRYRKTYEVVTMPGGHFLHREHPERFVAELLGALSRHAPIE
jgi:pimeloyl-ACP methyl ester carboxylesterase